MNISQVIASITVSFASSDIIKVDDTRIVVPVPIQISSNDTYEGSDGIEHSLPRTHTADSHLSIPVNDGNRDALFGSVTDGDNFVCVVADMSISDTRITGSSYTVTTSS